MTTRHSQSPFVNAVLRMVSFVVLCRYVLLGGGSIILFGGDGSSSTSSSSSSSSSSFESSLSSSLSSTTVASSSSSSSSTTLAAITTVLTTTRGGGDDDDDAAAAATATATGDDATSSSSSSSEIITNMKQQQQQEETTTTNQIINIDDTENNTIITPNQKIDTTTKTEETTNVDDDVSSSNTSSIMTTTRQRELDQYSNETRTLAIASSSLLDLEHDAAVEWLSQEEDEEKEQQQSHHHVPSPPLPHSSSLELDDMDHHLHHHRHIIATSHTATTTTATSSSITSQSDLTIPGRHVHIVTTAALPWMTGTAVNPLLRAAYLHLRLQEINQQQQTPSNTSNTSTSWVTLIIPWLELQEDQIEVYNGRIFDSPQEQEIYIRNWLRYDANLPTVADELNIIFYPGRYHAPLGSVFAMGDIIDQLPINEQDHLDVCILEEPEHLNWFRAPGDGWTKRYKYVVGIVHTNYKEYANAAIHGVVSAPALSLMSTAMVRAYCHKVIKLSDVLQTFAPEKEITSNVHGVRGDFLSLPSDNNYNTPLASSQTSNNTTASHSNSNTKERKAYFIGKLLWAKGLDLILTYEDYYKQITGEYFPIDVYGSGPEQKEIARAFLGIRKYVIKDEDEDLYEKDGGIRDEGEEVKQPQQTRNEILTKAFAWANRRSIFRKPRRRAKRRVGGKISRTLDEYQELLQSLETLPLKAKVKAKVSMEKLQNSAKDTLEQLAEYADDLLLVQARLLSNSTSTATSLIESLHGKARAKLMQLSEDLPKTFYELRRQPIPSTFPGRVDHASLKDKYSIFINPSISEVLCTTTAEALAMGKFAIIPVHPSNSFFLKFPNCLAYRNKLEFVANLRWALTHDPEPLTSDLAREFTWEAATDRLIVAAAITNQEALERERLGKSRLDDRIAWFHNELGKGVKGDVIRKVFGAGPVSDQVKYEEKRRPRMEKVMASGDDDDSEFDQEGEVGNLGGLLLSRKFQKSSFVQAIRAATTNSIPSTELLSS